YAGLTAVIRSEVRNEAVNAAKGKKPGDRPVPDKDSHRSYFLRHLFREGVAGRPNSDECGVRVPARHHVPDSRSRLARITARAEHESQTQGPVVSIERLEGDCGGPLSMQRGTARKATDDSDYLVVDAQRFPTERA